MRNAFFRRHRTFSLLLLGLAVLLLIIAGLGIMFREQMEAQFIYFPIRESEGDPANFGLPFENVYFMTGDGVKLHGWFIPGEKDLTWLWFHGNAGNISHRLENLALLHEKTGVTFFIFDYRGYGQSEGRPSERGTYLDAKAAISYLNSRSDANNRRIYFGRSLGSAIAVEMALRHPPSGLILESAFPSIPYMARRLYPSLPVWSFLGTRYDSISKIGQIDTPLLMMHGDKDEIIPLEAGQALFEAARGDKHFYIISGAGHNDTYLAGGEAYFQELDHFIRKVGGD